MDRARALLHRVSACGLSRGGDGTARGVTALEKIGIDVHCAASGTVARLQCPLALTPLRRATTSGKRMAFGYAIMLVVGAVALAVIRGRGEQLSAPVLPGVSSVGQAGHSDVLGRCCSRSR